jgi:hypothetical protein
MIELDPLPLESDLLETLYLILKKNKYPFSRNSPCGLEDVTCS